jgi:Tetratricopeptide repeat
LHPYTLMSRNNLAAAYVAAGRPADAVRLHKRTLGDCMRLLGGSHPDTLLSQSNLAAAYVMAGQPADAVRLLERTLGDCMRLLGESHPDTLISRSNLADSLWAVGRFGEAFALFGAKGTAPPTDIDECASPTLLPFRVHDSGGLRRLGCRAGPGQAFGVAQPVRISSRNHDRVQLGAPCDPNCTRSRDWP